MNVHPHDNLDILNEYLRNYIFHTYVFYLVMINNTNMVQVGKELDLTMRSYGIDSHCQCENIFRLCLRVWRGI
jgi:hypothetical protein